MQPHRPNVWGWFVSLLEWAALGAALGSVFNVGWGTFLGLPAGVVVGTLSTGTWRKVKKRIPSRVSRVRLPRGEGPDNGRTIP
jgi:hypothetical protein